MPPQRAPQLVTIHIYLNQIENKGLRYNKPGEFLFSIIDTPNSKTLMATLWTSIGSHFAQDVELSNDFMLTSVAS